MTALCDVNTYCVYVWVVYKLIHTPQAKVYCKQKAYCKQRNINRQKKLCIKPLLTTNWSTCGLCPLLDKCTMPVSCAVLKLLSDGQPGQVVHSCATNSSFYAKLFSFLIKVNCFENWAQKHSTIQVAPAPCFFLFDLKKSFIVLPPVASPGGPFVPLNLRRTIVQWWTLSLHSYVCLFLPLITLNMSPAARLNLLPHATLNFLQLPCLL